MNFFNQTKLFYDGHTSSWLVKLDFVMAANGIITDDEKSKILPVYLDGQSMEAYLGLEEKIRKSYTEACKELKGRFQSDRYTAKFELEN